MHPEGRWNPRPGPWLGIKPGTWVPGTVLSQPSRPARALPSNIRTGISPLPSFWLRLLPLTSNTKAGSGREARRARCTWPWPLPRCPCLPVNCGSLKSDSAEKTNSSSTSGQCEPRGTRAFPIKTHSAPPQSWAEGHLPYVLRLNHEEIHSVCILQHVTISVGEITVWFREFRG